MADYYPLIARAVAGLEKNTGDARRALYERARAALVAQLTSATPSLSDSDVTRERLALEEAVRKVEAESARLTRAERRPDPMQKLRAQELPRWEEPPGAPGYESPPPLRRPDPPSPRSDNLRRPPPPYSPSKPASNGEERRVDPEFDHPVSDAPALAGARALRHPLRGPPSGERRSLLDSGLNNFRNVVTDDLGEVSARSGRDLPRGAPAASDRPNSDESLQDAPVPEMLEPALGMDEGRPLPSWARQPPELVRDEGEHIVPAPTRSYRELFRIAIALLVVAGLGGALAWQWPNIASVYRSLRAPAATEVAGTQASAPSSRNKITDRYEPGGTTQQSAALTPGAAVAQRVVLYEEDPGDPQGKRFVGSAIWRTETITPGPGQPAEVAIRADIEIPERRLAMTWSLRRNSDPGLPASHTVEIMFKLPNDFASGGVSNVPGILMKQAEQARGVPLAGLAVKVTNGFFLIGLSSVETDKERNVALLKERSWFDIPVVYNDNRRAILALEKGTPGERVFAEAFAAWRQ